MRHKPKVGDMWLWKKEEYVVLIEECYVEDWNGAPHYAFKGFDLTKGEIEDISFTMFNRKNWKRIS